MFASPDFVRVGACMRSASREAAQCRRSRRALHWLADEGLMSGSQPTFGHYATARGRRAEDGRQRSSLAHADPRRWTHLAGFLSCLRRQPPCRNAVVKTIEPRPDCVGHNAWIAGGGIRDACPNETFDVKALFRPSPPGIAVAGEDSVVLVADRNITHGRKQGTESRIDGRLPKYLLSQSQ